MEGRRQRSDPTDTVLKKFFQLLLFTETPHKLQNSGQEEQGSDSASYHRHLLLLHRVHIPTPTLLSVEKLCEWRKSVLGKNVCRCELYQEASSTRLGAAGLWLSPTPLLPSPSSATPPPVASQRSPPPPSSPPTSYSLPFPFLSSLPYLRQRVDGDCQKRGRTAHAAGTGATPDDSTFNLHILCEVLSS